MAVPAARSDLIGIPLNPVPSPGGARPFPLPSDGAIEVLGRAVDDLRAAPPAESDAASAETLHALRLLALDNLIDLVQLRELLAEREMQLRGLKSELSSWREQALRERAEHTTAATEAHLRERELVSALHHALVENDTLQEELAWRRRPWWRRGHRPAAATRALSPLSAPG